MVFAGINDYARAFVFVNADAQKAGRDRPENVRRVAGRNVRCFVLKFECGVGAMRVERWHGARQNAGRALAKIWQCAGTNFGKNVAEKSGHQKSSEFSAP